MKKMTFALLALCAMCIAGCAKFNPSTSPLKGSKFFRFGYYSSIADDNVYYVLTFFADTTNGVVTGQIKYSAVLSKPGTGKEIGKPLYYVYELGKKVINVWNYDAKMSDDNYKGDGPTEYLYPDENTVKVPHYSISGYDSQGAAVYKLDGYYDYVRLK